MTPYQHLIKMIEPLEFKDPYESSFDCIKSLPISIKKFKPEVHNFLQETSILIQMENKIIDDWNSESKDSPLSIHFDAFMVNYKNEIKTITSILTEDEHNFFNYLMSFQKIEWTNNMLQSSLACHHELWESIKKLDFGSRILDKINKPWEEIMEMSWKSFFQIFKEKRDSELKLLHEINGILQDGISKVSALKLSSFQEIKRHLQLLWMKQDMELFFWSSAFKDFAYYSLENKNFNPIQECLPLKNCRILFNEWINKNEAYQTPININGVDLEWVQEIVLFNAILYQEKNHLSWIQMKWPKIHAEIEQEILSQTLIESHSSQEVKRL